MPFKRLSIAVLFALAAPAVQAQDSVPTASGQELDTVKVTGVRSRLEQTGRLAETIEKTELITRDDLDRRQAGSLAQAIDNTPGIRVQNECSMCGIKRVMINGMKGEQTTILVDGVPMHSVVSSYYGIDAITSSGIGSIEIARGPGAALSTPEAIGGAINIVSERGTANGIRGDFSFGSDGYRRASLTATGLTADGRGEGVAALQYDNIDRFDGDNNGVTESPDLSNRGLTLRGSYDLSERDNLEARFAVYRSRVFGGPTSAGRGEVFAGARSGIVSEPWNLFAGGDVRERFTGLAYETAEIIDTDRQEGMLRWIRQINESGDNLQLTASLVKHGQDSIYEGFDYRNDDDILWLDGKYSVGFGDGHLLSLGLNLHREKMRSESEALEDLQAIDPTVYGDSFDYQAAGTYAQADFAFGDNLELSLAGRFDQIKTDYIEQPGGEEINRTLFSPRALLKWRHSDTWTSRLSAGRGYRAPLSFFESDHGLLDDGYEVEVSDVERSLSFGYALNYANEGTAAALSLNTTSVDNSAFIDFDGPRPVLRNYAQKVRVDTFDIQFSHAFTDYFSIGGGGEIFRYDRPYRATFAIAPIEERLRFFSDYNGHGWSAYAQLTWVGDRDLARYDTADRFNVQAPDGTLSAPKGTRAASYISLDARVERALGEHWSVYIGGTNLTDYNQAADEESPLFFDGDGGYDVVHIYAPLRGRVLYAGARWQW